MRSGNILQEIWLNKDNIDKAYKETNRMDIKNITQTLLSLLKTSKFEQSWIEQYRNDMICYINEKHKPNHLFPFQFAEDILKVLSQVDKKQEILKRVLSIKCFGDSKYFEKNIEHIIIIIIKKYLIDDESQDEYSNDEILMKIGISKYPEIIEFCGDLEYCIKNERIECKKETLGSYINSYNVKEMQKLKIRNANKIIFIENKANYIDYIQNKKADNEFVIYHGGMYSPTKGNFFLKIHEAAKGKEFYHWSDIDIGGFKIFIRLRKIIPELQQYKMDKEAFYSKQDSWKEMSRDYQCKLNEMRHEEKYSIFYDVIDVMLKNNSKLEQEAFI